MRHGIGGVLLATSLASLGVAGAQADPLSEADEDILDLTAEALAEGPARIPHHLCARVSMSGDLVHLGIVNLRREQLEVVIIDPFGALGGRSLRVLGMDFATSPAGGTATEQYPLAPAGGRPPAFELGVGPAVATFTSFDAGDAALLHVEFATYDDPPRPAATLAELDHTRIEAVYAGDLRCAGELLFDPVTELSTALLQQTFPRQR